MTQALMEIPNNIDFVEQITKIRLSIPFVAYWLRQAKFPADIAKIAGTSTQAVCQFIQRHTDDLAPLLPLKDEVRALEALHIYNKANKNLITALNKKPTKKDMDVLNKITAEQIKIYRLLSDQSTANISVKVQDCSDYQDNGDREPA